jgi:uncharacterized protein (DUF58 family)
VLLTKSGLGLALAAVVLGVCGVWWRYQELTVVAVAAAVALVIALWASRIGHQARIQRSIPAPRVARGDPIRVIYRAVNNTRRRTVPAVIVDRCDGAEVRVPIPAIGRDDRTEVLGVIPTRRRGVHPVGPWRLERVDALALAVGTRASEEFGTVLVHPRVHELTGPYGAMHTVEDEAVIRRLASDPLSGFVSLREYVEGDDPRLIHWPTSARMGTLMIREHVELRRPEFTVVLDAAAGVGTEDDFEEMVDVAASVAVHALRSGVDVRLRTTAREFPGSARPLERSDQVLDLLTPVMPAAAGSLLSLAEIFRSGLDHTAIVFITGPEGPSSTLTHTDRLTVVRVGRGATGGTGVSLAVEDALEFVNRWRPWF